MTKEKGSEDLLLFDVRAACKQLVDCIDLIRSAQDDVARTSACLTALDALGAAFYAASANIGVHPVIEFTGLLRTYTAQIKVAVKSGVPLHEISGVHGDRTLPFSAGQAAYIAEKLDCIWGESFRQDQEAARALFDKLLGEKVAESLAQESLSAQAVGNLLVAMMTWIEELLEAQEFERVDNFLLMSAKTEPPLLRCLLAITEQYAEHLPSRDKLRRELIKRDLAYLAGDSK